MPIILDYAIQSRRSDLNKIYFLSALALRLIRDPLLIWHVSCLLQSGGDGDDQAST
jgi:hypothetical protein